MALAASYRIFGMQIEPLRRPFAYYHLHIDGTGQYVGRVPYILLYFPRPSATEKGYWRDRKSPTTNIPRADTLASPITIRNWRDLWWNYIEFIKPYDVMRVISFFVYMELNRHSRGYPVYTHNNIALTEIFDKSPLKYNKQSYNVDGRKGAAIQFKDLYTINKIHLKYGKLTGKKDASDGEITEATVFDFRRLATDGRWNNLWEFLETLTLGNLVKVRIKSENFIVEKAKEVVNTANRKIVVKQNSPCEVYDIAFNALNPLDNIDIVYLESTQDDITNHRDAINGVSNTKDSSDVTMQLVWHNQPPNNAAGWNRIARVRSSKGSSESYPAMILSRVDAEGNIGKEVRWDNFGRNTSNESAGEVVVYSGRRRDLGDSKSGSQFVYLLWYFDNLNSMNSLMFNADMPFLVHNGFEGFDMAFGTSNEREPSAIIKEIQEKGCVHNQIIQHIRSEWNSGNPTHYGCTLKIPITILESLFAKDPESQVLTSIFDLCNYEIDTVARFGIDLSKAKGWIVMGFKVDYQSGFAEINLINNR